MSLWLSGIWTRYCASNLQTLYTEGLERLQRRQDDSSPTESSWKQASRHVALNLLRDWAIACCGSRIKTFPKMEKLWTEIRVLFNYLSFIKSWHDAKVSNKGPEGVSHFLSRITLAHRFCKLIASWTCGLFSSCPPDNNPRSQVSQLSVTEIYLFFWKGQVAFLYSMRLFKNSCLSSCQVV